MKNKIYLVDGKEYLVWHDALKKVIYATPKDGKADIKVIRKGSTQSEVLIRKAIAKSYNNN